MDARCPTSGTIAVETAGDIATLDLACHEMLSVDTGALDDEPLGFALPTGTPVPSTPPFSCRTVSLYCGDGRTEADAVEMDSPPPIAALLECAVVNSPEERERSSKDSRKRRRNGLYEAEEEPTTVQSAPPTPSREHLYNRIRASIRRVPLFQMCPTRIDRIHRRRRSDARNRCSRGHDAASVASEGQTVDGDVRIPL